LQNAGILSDAGVLIKPNLSGLTPASN